MDSMKLSRGPLVSVFGTAVVLFVFFLALSFGWSWWEFLVVEAAVLATLFVCSDSVKEEIGWQCVGIFLSLAMLGFAARKAELSVALVNVERFLANHATAVQAVAAIVMALFTVALWRATLLQAKATEGMRRLEEQLVSFEIKPLVAITNVAFFETVRAVGEKGDGIGVLDEPTSSILEVRFRVSNVGRRGLVLKTAAIFVSEGGGVYYPVRLSPSPDGDNPVVAPGGSVMFKASHEQAHEHAYQLFRAIESCLPAHNSISKAWSCVGLAIEVVHGGSLGESEWLCFTLGLGAKTESGYRAVGYQSSCSKDVIVSVEKAQLLS